MKNTGCSACDSVQTETGNKTEMCPKHEVEQLKWRANKAKEEYKRAKNAYEEEIIKQRKEREKQNE